MTRGRSYKDLIVWQKARCLAVAVYRQTSQLPSHERFGLTSQMRRAAVSVLSNIAEGAGRGTDSEFRYFLRIARGSLAELETQLLLAGDLGYVDNSWDAADIAEVGRLLNGLIASISSERSL